MIKTNPLPPIEFLRERFTFDSERGILTRNHKVGKHNVGDVVGTPLKEGHLLTSVCGKRFLVHRIIFFMATGKDPGDMLVDHINGNPIDNRPCNLRLATNAQNVSNMHRNRSDNKSGERNVSWNNYWKRWQVSVAKGDGKRVQRKFVDKNDAIACARNLRAELFGEFAGSV